VNVLFVNYYDFTSNSAVHLFNLANELDRAGVGAAVAVTERPDSVELIGRPSFQALDFRQARRGGLRFPDGAPPSLVHAWTPREAVRELVEDLCARYGCPYLVHLEDNEDVLTANALGLTLEQLDGVNGSVPTVAHPRRMRSFLAGAAGLSVIVDRLLEFQPDGIPSEVVWPAYEPDLFTAEPPDPELRRRLGIADNESVLVYAGNAHPSNASELRSLYLAVGSVNRAGRPLKLVRLGRDYVQFVERELRSVERHVVRVPLQPRAEVPRYLRLADVLVQPGRPDAFNEYRFPSKLPEFFATGRPVVLPSANVGRFVRDGEEALVLQRGDALEIAAAVERVLDDDDLRLRLARGAREFAERSFSWSASAEKLRHLYERALRPPAVPETALRDVRDRYAGRAVPRLGYGTVRDYVDSAEGLPSLATASRDLKDVQRPWAVKAILGSVDPGSRLLEIGAGEPVVAELLSRLGYDVTVVDPYDGRDRGPTDVDAVRAAAPRVSVLQGLFPRDLPDDARFDCIYSISVLEHLPTEALDRLGADIGRFTRNGGSTIHAIDHVLRGPGDAEHLARLRRLAASFGVAQRELDELLARLDADPETYFLSAESHNRWRAGARYDEFPMRRCVSIQLCLPTA
jgi:glycosyltransferase involved in cell wall biosynthesis/2-polyprenyl-3-methyl-5-hydroxy-6-metoxy-1,4-benzoquinol methylase